jgi:hypothetical protein
MKLDPSSGDLEKDPVWALLRETSAKRPSPNFAANVVRAARLESQAKPWWKSLWLPLTAGGALAGAAALVVAVISMQTGTPSKGGGSDGKLVSNPPDSSLAELQDAVDNEVFLAATEHLGKYSDEELVSMIGF